MTAAAYWLHQQPVPPFTTADGSHPVSVVLLALVLGMFVRNLIPATTRLKPGATLVVKRWLPAGIVLLGANLDFYDLLRVGGQALLAAAALIAAVIGATGFLAGALGLRFRLGLLIGVGTAICGTSAIVATAPVIEAEEEDVGISVATVNLFGVLAMLAFPGIAALTGMGATAFGAWCGFSIHATPQVLAAAFAHVSDGVAAGEIATVVKLTRVSLLAPMVFVVGLAYGRHRRKEDVYIDKPLNLRELVPGFVVLFLVMALLRTLGFFPEATFHMTDRFPLGAGDRLVDLAQVLTSSAKVIITCSMAAVGLGIEFKSLKAGGMRPFVVGLLATLVVSGLGLAPALWLI